MTLRAVPETRARAVAFAVGKPWSEPPRPQVNYPCDPVLPGGSCPPQPPPPPPPQTGVVTAADVSLREVIHGFARADAFQVRRVWVVDVRPGGLVVNGEWPTYVDAVTGEPVRSR